MPTCEFWNGCNSNSPTQPMRLQTSKYRALILQGQADQFKVFDNPDQGSWVRREQGPEAGDVREETMPEDPLVTQLKN